MHVILSRRGRTNRRPCDVRRRHSPLLGTTKGKGAINHMLEGYEGRDLSVPDKLLDMTPIVTDEGTKLYQASYTKKVIIERVSSFDVRKVSAPLEWTVLCSLGLRARGLIVSMRTRRVLIDVLQIK